MLSRDLGGIQQAFLDYNKFIELSGNVAISVTATGAKINSNISSNYKLSNYLSFDPFSILALRRIIKLEKPEIIIAHGKRAINFALFARMFLKQKVIIIGVAHNYWYKPLLKCDYIFSITQHLKDFLANKGAADEKIFVMPNVIDVNSYKFSSKKPSKTIRIGVLSRLIHKKGVDVFVKALSLLKHDKIEFKATIGGDGEDLESLKKLAKDLDVEIDFAGWVQDKDKFFKNIDILCLPSRHEPFGIILLEAALSKTPIITTRSEGPVEIFTDKKEACFVDIESPEQIAEKIIYLLENKELSKKLSESAFLRVVENYDINSSAKRLKKIIKHVI